MADGGARGGHGLAADGVMRQACGVGSAPFRCLASLAGAQATGRDTPRPLLARSDGAALLALAIRHRVAAPVLEALAECEAFDAVQRTTLLGRAARLRRQSLNQARLTADLSRALAAEGIEHLVLKGAPLSLQLYGEPVARHSRDIDLLVQPRALAQADAVLASHGFSRVRAGLTPPSHDPLRRRLVKDDSYEHDDEGSIVELHWRLFHTAQLAPWSFEALWSQRCAVRVGDTWVPTLSPSHSLIYLACHGASHFWFRLKWLQDIARITTLGAPDDFAAVAGSARDMGLQACVAAAVQLSETLFEARAPAVLADLAPASAVGPIRDFCLRSLELPADQSTGGGAWRQLQVFRFLLRLRRSWRYRLNVVSGVLVSPLDHDRLQLPPAAGVLYYPLRPVLMLLRRVGAPSRR